MSIALPRDVTATESADGLVLLDQRNGRYWMLNGTGATTLRLILDGYSPMAATARLARELRRHDLVIELGDESFRLKKSLETASKLGARFAIIVGENEVKADVFALKNLATGEQVTVPRGELAKRIQSTGIK